MTMCMGRVKIFELNLFVVQLHFMTKCLRTLRAQLAWVPQALLLPRDRRETYQASGETLLCDALVG